MSTDEPRHDAATSTDLSRQAATTSDSDFSLSIEDALARYEQAGIPRTSRSIQRYCAKGDLDCHRVETSFGIKFLIAPASIDRHIAYINEVRLVATSRDLPRQVATDVAAKNNDAEPRHEAATSTDEVRQPATTESVSHAVVADTRIVQLLERENEFLRGQVAVKDEQIKNLNDRVRETNVLTGGLQKLLMPLLGGRDHIRDDNLSAGE